MLLHSEGSTYLKLYDPFPLKMLLFTDLFEYLFIPGFYLLTFSKAG